jgi:hypothetical protein
MQARKRGPVTVRCACLATTPRSMRSTRDCCGEVAGLWFPHGVDGGHGQRTAMVYLIRMLTQPAAGRRPAQVRRSRGVRGRRSGCPSGGGFIRLVECGPGNGKHAWSLLSVRAPWSPRPCGQLWPELTTATRTGGAPVGFFRWESEGPVQADHGSGTHGPSPCGWLKDANRRWREPQNGGLSLSNKNGDLRFRRSPATFWSDTDRI